MLYDKIKKIADLQGISIYRLEKETEVGKNTINRWNDNIPSADKLHRVAKFLGVSSDELIEEADVNRKDFVN